MLARGLRVAFAKKAKVQLPMEEINQHYRQAMRMYHPDKVAGMAPEIIALAERRTKELNAAFSEAKRVRSSTASK